MSFWVYYQPASKVSPVMTLGAADVAAALGAAAAEPLGSGSFGETWKIFVPGDLDSAAKIIKDDSYPMDRVAREVEGLTRATSPHVVRILDALDITLPVGKRIALIFEYIDGGDLASNLTLGAPIDPETVREFARGLLAGIADLHGCQIIHRDIKPENIALRDGDMTQPVILDLGLARILDLGTLTAYPMHMGTPAFMAPEQLRGVRAGKLADLFSAGIVLHIMLSGEHPFYGDFTAKVTPDEAVRIIPSGPRSLPAGTPGDLRELVTRLLNPKPHKRGSAARALRDLNPTAQESE